MPLPRRRTRPRLRALTALAMVFTLTVALSGCMKVDAQLVVHEDDTISGSVVLALDKRLAGLTGKSENQLVDSLGVDADKIAAGATTEPYSDAGFVGHRIVFTGTRLSDFHGTGDHDSLTLTHSGRSYLLNGVIDLRTVNLGEPAVQRFADMFSFQVSVTFPGKVVEHNGVLNGQTVTWSPEAGQSLALHARAEEPGITWWPWALGAGVFIIVIAAAGLVWALSRRRALSVPVVETRHDML
jgi:LppM domain